MRGRVSKVVQSAKKQKEIVEQFQDNVSQSTTINTLNISLSRLHTISKRFRQLGEISVHKGQGRNSILDDCDVWALRRPCIKCRHSGMGTGTPLEIIVCKHSSPTHPQLQVKPLSCKEDAICEHDPEILLSSLGQS